MPKPKEVKRVPWVVLLIKLRYTTTFQQWLEVHQESTGIRRGCCDEVGATGDLSLMPCPVCLAAAYTSCPVPQTVSPDVWFMLGCWLCWFGVMQLQTLIFRSVAEPDTTLALLLREVDYDMLKKYLNSVSRSLSWMGVAYS